MLPDRNDRNSVRPAVFFDRDGVLNEDRGYVYKTDDFCWLPHAREAIVYANTQGYRVFVVTNQSGIARGMYSTQEMHILHEHMQRDVHAMGGHIHAFAYCPHHPQAVVPEFRCVCACRKPAPGMIVEIMRQWPTLRERSFLLGDKPRDIAAARASNIYGYLLQPQEDVLMVVQKIIESGNVHFSCLGCNLTA